MDLIDEQNIARLQIGQHGGQVAAALDHRAGGGTEPHTHLARDDLREGRLAETWRSREEDMIEGFAPAPRRLDEDAQIVAQLALTDELVEGRRAQRGLDCVLRVAGGIDDARRRAAHRASSCSPARINAPASAPLPRRCAAAATAPKASVRR